MKQGKAISFESFKYKKCIFQTNLENFYRDFDDCSNHVETDNLKQKPNH